MTTLLNTYEYEEDIDFEPEWERILVTLEVVKVSKFIPEIELEEWNMNIDFNDLSEEQQKVLLNNGKIRGYSREEIIDRFNDAASDSDNALDFFDNDEFIEDTLRRDSSLLSEYLDFIISKI